MFVWPVNRAAPFVLFGAKIFNVYFQASNQDFFFQQSSRRIGLGLFVKLHCEGCVRLFVFVTNCFFVIWCDYPFSWTNSSREMWNVEFFFFSWQTWSVNKCVLYILLHIWLQVFLSQVRKGNEDGLWLEGLVAVSRLYAVVGDSFRVEQRPMSEAAQPPKPQELIKRFSTDAWKAALRNRSRNHENTCTRNRWDTPLGGCRIASDAPSPNGNSWMIETVPTAGLLFHE